MDGGLRSIALWMDIGNSIMVIPRNEQNRHFEQEYESR